MISVQYVISKDMWFVCFYTMYMIVVMDDTYTALLYGAFILL